MQPPQVPGEDKYQWWQQLREVPCSWLSSQGEEERFLYYDGPVNARSPVAATRQREELRVEHRRISAGRLEPEVAGDRRCFVVDQQGHEPRMLPLIFDKNETSSVHSLSNDQSWITGQAVEDTFLQVLQDRGLSVEEAAGFMKVWRDRFFQRPGRRLITFLTASEYERMINLNVTPPATTIVRVGLVLKEFAE